MANHPRQRIREAVQGLLKGKTDAGDRVFATREVPWKRTDLPGIAVYALDETSEPSLESNATTLVLERTLQIAVLVVVSLTETVDDELDAMASEVEALMAKDYTFGLADLRIDSGLKSTAIEVTEEQGRPIGAIRLTYEVTYYTDVQN